MKLADLFSQQQIVNEGTTSDEFKKIVKLFLTFAQRTLKLQKIPRIYLQKTLDDGDQPTHGQYYPNANVVKIAISNRQPADILRSLAHELVHVRQNEQGIDIDSTTGSDDENEANAVAGSIMRDFNKEYPEFLSFQPIEESVNNGRKCISKLKRN